MKYNPFAYEAATSLEPSDIVQIYIEDFNFSRFIDSTKNIFLVGERGTGKSMALRYNSLPVQFEKNRRIPQSKIINIYIPCHTMLTQSKEHETLDEVQAFIVSEHFLVISMLYHLISSLKVIDNIFNNVDENSIIDDLNYTLNFDIPKKYGVIDGICRYLQRTLSTTKMNLLESISNVRATQLFPNMLSFAGHAVPLMEQLIKIPVLNGCHFSLMLDDEQHLNLYQVKKVNSWIAHRDHSLFSFKIATTKIDKPPYITDGGAYIIEGHDFTLIDMEQEYYNQDSNFGKLAFDIITRRIHKLSGLEDIDAKKYFPENENFIHDIEEAREEVKTIAEAKFPNGPAKSINDYIYKYTRAHYFRNRSSKANRPPYSGFETIVQMSTGVVRNLLEPCFWMYDSALSEAKRHDDESVISSIPAKIQTEIILDQSQKKWQWLREGLDKVDANCTHEQAKQIYALIDNICLLFRKRLLEDISEPRAVMFSISDKRNDCYDYVIHLINIARRSQYIYERLGNSKDEGREESYYIVNKILLPARGLDPVGQHARVSITSQRLYDAAVFNKPIPMAIKDFQDGPSLLDLIK